ncbi:MAG: hypothetical protein V8T36_00695 [Ruthenibacterium lactatiformans]
MQCVWSRRYTFSSRTTCALRGGVHRAAKEEYEHYKMQLERSRTRYKIVEETVYLRRCGNKH